MLWRGSWGPTHKDRRAEMTPSLPATHCRCYESGCRTRRGNIKMGESLEEGVLWWWGRSGATIRARTHTSGSYWVFWMVSRKKDLSPNSIDAKWEQTVTPTLNDGPHGYTLVHIHMCPAKSNTWTKHLLEGKNTPASRLPNLLREDHRSSLNISAPNT